MLAKLLDPSWKYTPAAKTDIRKTFARIRRELRDPKPATTEIFYGTTRIETIDGRPQLVRFPRRPSSPS